MRLISKNPGQKVTAIPGEDDLFTGRQKRAAIVADFRIGPLHPWEVQAARDRLRFKGTTQSGEPGAAGPVNDPIARVSYYDTVEAQQENGWTDEFREKVEQGLLRNRFHGSDFVHVETPELTPPWPKYDDLVAHGRRTIEMVAERIATTITDLGLSVEDVLAYEKANLNRPEVVNALLGVEEHEEDAIVVGA